MWKYALSLLLLTGCASDPLGQVGDHTASGGVICRNISGNVNTTAGDGQGTGFRCLDLGPIDGCVRYDNGQFEYESAACSD